MKEKETIPVDRAYLELKFQTLHDSIADIKATMVSKLDCQIKHEPLNRVVWVIGIVFSVITFIAGKVL